MSTVVSAVCTLGGLSVTLSLLLVLANKKLFVPEDPRLDAVEDMLPHTNCGACGYPGCRAFAEALVGGDALPGKCTVSPEGERARIARFLGVDVGAEEKRVARLACAGGVNVARSRADYRGLGTCRAATLVGGGGKSCSWGCLGLGDCQVVCDFDAIEMNAFSLPVVVEGNCTACNACVEVCPKDLFSLHPVSHRLWVACKNLEEGDQILEDCEVGCTGCGRCAMDAPRYITMTNHLPVVDYTAAKLNDEPIQRCPTGAIVWIGEDDPGNPIRGREAGKILRKEPLPAAPT